MTVLEALAILEAASRFSNVRRSKPCEELGDSADIDNGRNMKGKF